MSLYGVNYRATYDAYYMLQDEISSILGEHKAANTSFIRGCLYEPSWEGYKFVDRCVKRDLARGWGGWGAVRGVEIGAGVRGRYGVGGGGGLGWGRGKGGRWEGFFEPYFEPCVNHLELPTFIEPCATHLMQPSYATNCCALAYILVVGWH